MALPPRGRSSGDAPAPSCQGDGCFSWVPQPGPHAGRLCTVAEPLLLCDPCTVNTAEQRPVTEDGHRKQGSQVPPSLAAAPLTPEGQLTSLPTLFAQPFL